MQPGHALAVGGIDHDFIDGAFLRQALFDFFEKLIDALAIKRRDQHAIVAALGLGFAGCQCKRIEKVGLVPDFDDLAAAVLVDAELFQHQIHVMALRLGFLMADIAHMQDDIGGEHLLERGAEGCDQRGGKFGDEADRVGQNDVAAAAAA